VSDPTPRRPEVVVFDLDGVIRDWNDDELAELETSFGLEPGEIVTVAFARELGRAATTGQLNYRAWMDEIRRRIMARHGAGVAAALDEWERNVGRVDTEMLAVLRAVRRHVPAVVLSNGTTRLRRDLHALDLADEFDRIFNTAEIGIAKPEPAVFEHVLSELGRRPDEVVFIDDLAENVEGARSVGIRSHQHLDRHGIVEFLAEVGLHLG
jgi:HAD superfamily hydrolase (TIGR01509 family)